MTTLPPHPRETFGWLGERVEAEFADAIARGRVHHAWLFTGPRGVGKATLAYRVARRMLGAADDPARGPLGSAPSDPVSRQVMARAHPDLMVLQREDEQGKPRRSIPVDEARTLGEFFAKSPAIARWRVAIIDAADDLNDAAANAVLKTLEEPPARGLLMMISHSPGRLLATVRSRCRRLRFAPPPGGVGADWVRRASGLDADAADRLLAISGGGPGGAWRLAGKGALELDAAASELLSLLPATDTGSIEKLASRFRGADGLDEFRLFFHRLANHVGARAKRACIGAGGSGPADRWAAAAGMLVDLVDRVEAVNLDRGDALQVAVGRLRALAQGRPC